MAGLIEMTERLEDSLKAVWSLSFAAGFALADIPECGPAIIVYADDQVSADAIAEQVLKRALDAEREFSGTLYRPAEAVQRAMTIPGPVLLADTQDNPGAGGTSDTVGLLRALLDAGAKRAVLAVLYDPEVAAQAHAAGEGSIISVALGAKSGMPSEAPIKGPFLVKKLGNGRFTGTGPFYHGCRMDLGQMALLVQDGVAVVVSSRRQQAADQAILRHLGIDPINQQILALKSSVHFRADFGSIAKEILLVEAPGANLADPRTLPYRRLRPGLRIGPCNQTFGSVANNKKVPV